MVVVGRKGGRRGWIYKIDLLALENFKGVSPVWHVWHFLFTGQKGNNKQAGGVEVFAVIKVVFQFCVAKQIRLAYTGANQIVQRFMPVSIQRSWQ